MSIADDHSAERNSEVGRHVVALQVAISKERGNSTRDSEPIDRAGRIEGAGSLVKIGTGTFTLQGANTYTGATRVIEGTVALAGAGVGAAA